MPCKTLCVFLLRVDLSQIRKSAGALKKVVIGKQSLMVLLKEFQNIKAFDEAGKHTEISN